MKRLIVRGLAALVMVFGLMTVFPVHASTPIKDIDIWMEGHVLCLKLDDADCAYDLLAEHWARVFDEA